MSGVAGARPGTVVLLASLGGATVTSGVQGIAPALPAIQGALGLSDAQVSLLTSVYLLPGVLLAFPGGLLTERIGRRAMYGLSLGLFGLGGLAQVLVPTLPVILGVRALQGVAFGIVLSLTITMIGDVTHGSAQVSAQGRRIVAMSAGETLFPAAAGLLVGVAWYAPFGLQATALVFAVVGWFVLPATTDGGGRPRGSTRQVTSSLRDQGVIALQLLAFLRFFFKFALLTYYPILAVNERGVSAATVGLALGASALLGTLAAALTSVSMRFVSASMLMGVSLAVIGGSMVLLAAIPASWALVAGVQFFALADGQFSVAHNVLVTQAAPPAARAAFVAFTGTVRNLGKLVAPLAFGAATVLVPVAGAFAVWGAMGLGAVAVSRGVGPLERSLPTPPPAPRHGLDPPDT